MDIYAELRLADSALHVGPTGALLQSGRTQMLATPAYMSGMLLLPRVLDCILAQVRVCVWGCVCSGHCPALGVDVRAEAVGEHACSCPGPGWQRMPGARRFGEPCRKACTTGTGRNVI